jgi:hypothetical protein
MASFTLNTNYLFASGDIGAYPASNWQGPPSGAPVGSATNTQTISGGSVTFTGLTAGARYYATDATGTKYVQFTVPPTSLSTTNIAALATGTQAAIDAEATSRGNADTLLVAVDTAILAVYKPLLWRNTFINDAQTAATRLATVQAAVVGSTSNTTTAGVSTFYFNASDFAVGGKTTKLNLQATMLTNATTPTTLTVTANMHAVSAVAGTADVSAVTLGSAVSGASVAFVDQAASTIANSTSGDFTAPASGLYALTVQNSATPAADTFYSLSLCLRFRHV